MTYNIFARGEYTAAAVCDRIRFSIFGVWGRDEENHRAWTFIPWRRVSSILRYKGGGW